MLLEYGTNPLKNILIYDAYWRILRNTNINSKVKLESYGQNQWPKAILIMVVLQSIFHPTILKNRVISKLLMIFSYIYNVLNLNL